MFSKFLRRNGKVIVAIIISITLCIAIPFILNHFVFTNGSKPNLTNSEWSTFLGSYIGGILGGTATLIAVIISLNISKNIQVESELRVNSLIVYYDLVLGSTDLKRLYINSKNKEFKNIPSRMFFSKDWIKNVAMISGKIRDTASLYKLYTDLEIVGEELKIKSEAQILKSTDDFDYVRYDKIIYKVSNNVFSNKFLNINMEEYDGIDDVLNVDEELNTGFKKIITDLKYIID